MTPDQIRIAQLEAEVAQLKVLVQFLLEELAHYKNPKNSRNSSIPPSKDENRPLKTRSLRTPSNKKQGGQPGHEGSTLEMTKTPNQVLEYKPATCKNCGNSLSDVEAILAGRRQVIDIPPIVPQYTEHRIFKTTCTCGCINTTTFPVGVNAPVCYGANIESTIAYLHSRQYLPSERMHEFFKDVYHLPISEGAIYNILERFAQKSIPAYKAIQQEITKSKVVGADETGAKVNGKKHWFWTWQNNSATFIAISGNRGTQTITDNFHNGIPDAVLVHDCWKSHFETNVRNHQVCTAHLLRELNYFEERYKHSWASDFKKMLYDALDLKNALKRYQYYYHIPERTKLEERFNTLLKTVLPPDMKELITFQKRMLRYRDYVFTFLYDPNVPSDNNGSERAIRNIKVKQKISGQFKSIRGAECFAIIRSITDTCIKNGQSVLYALSLIAKLQPE